MAEPYRTRTLRWGEHQRLVTLRTMTTRHGVTAPAGTEVTGIAKRSGLEVATKPCPHDGISFCVAGVPAGDFRFAGGEPVDVAQATRTRTQPPGHRTRSTMAPIQRRTSGMRMGASDASARREPTRGGTRVMTHHDSTPDETRFTELIKMLEEAQRLSDLAGARLTGKKPETAASAIAATQRVVTRAVHAARRLEHAESDTKPKPTR